MSRFGCLLLLLQCTELKLGQECHCFSCRAARLISAICHLPPSTLPLQMVTHYISNIIPEQAGHAGGESISWKIQNWRLLSWICSLHHTKWRLVPRPSAPPAPPGLLADSSFPTVSFPTATPEPGEDPRVTRAKFFIRDEFLVSVSLLGQTASNWLLSSGYWINWS